MFEALLSNRTVSVLVEALPRILTAGLTMTIPLTLVSFFFAMIIAVVVALVQYAAAGAAVHHLLRPAQPGHHAGRLSRRRHRLCLQ